MTTTGRGITEDPGALPLSFSRQVMHIRRQGLRKLGKMELAGSGRGGRGVIGRHS
jgi:hypothetical protein